MNFVYEMYFVAFFVAPLLLLLLDDWVVAVLFRSTLVETASSSSTLKQNDRASQRLNVLVLPWTFYENKKQQKCVNM